MNIDLVNIIFGMKLRQARTKAKLTVTEFATQAQLSPSYVTEIEKGRKYPKPDKILKMAEVLGKSYDELVAIKLDPGLAQLELVLKSPLIRHFPFEEFGVEVGDMLEILTNNPAKASALLSAVEELARQSNLQEEHFLRAALRSYQEIHENYFPEEEAAAREFAQTHHLNELPIRLEQLESLIQEKFHYTLDKVTLGQNEVLHHYRSVYVNGARPLLLMNPALYPQQWKFLLAREIGYQVLGLKERANTSSPDRVESYQQVLNDFLASYFAGALLMPQKLMLADIQAFFAETKWDAQRLLALLNRYDVTPEMLFYRFSELIPQFFGIALHFLRMQGGGQDYKLVKQLNMSQVLIPQGVDRLEHFCRRWLTVRLLRELPAQKNAGTPHVGVQLSEFLETHHRFLCIGVARPLVLSPTVNSSVIIGFRVDRTLQESIRFWDDPNIPSRIINETCERCPLSYAECSDRGAEQTIWRANQLKIVRQEALNKLMAQLKK